MADRDGQIVFITPPQGPVVTEDASLGEVVLTRCEQADEGLLVEGSVATDGGVTGVIVSGGPSDAAGVAVGAGSARGARLSPTADRPGDFVVTIPWATGASVFRTVDPGSLAPGESEVRVGLQSGCP